MPNSSFLRLLLPATLALACDAPDPADAPDRGEDDPAEVAFRTGPGTYGGSTRLNTAKLFLEGMPLRHFNRAGAMVVYDDPRATQVTFKRLRLALGAGDYEPMAHTILVDAGRVRVDGALLLPAKLLGSEWHYEFKDNLLPPRSVVLTVTGVGVADTPAGDLPLYNFNLGPATAFYDKGQYSTCDKLDLLTAGAVTANPATEGAPIGIPNNFKLAFSAALYGNVKVSELGTVLFDGSVATVACVSGAVGKAGLWGYAPWVSSYLGRTGVQQLQAATRAIRADFCANGTSNTADGTPIQVRDRYFNTFTDPTEATESVWSTNGATCQVTTDRLASGATHTCGGALGLSCNQAASNWITGPDEFMWIKVDPATTTYPTKTPCNTPAATPGCADPGIEETVCSVDAYCCTGAWDAICVNKVTATGATADACCAANGGPGCGDPAVTTCVAGYDASCGTTYWDSWCVAEVEHLGCGRCR
jgi:hypothetical protein